MIKVLTAIFAAFSIIFLVLIGLQLRLEYDYDGRCKRICGKSEVLSCEEPYLICYQKYGTKEQYWIFEFDLVKVD